MRKLVLLVLLLAFGLASAEVIPVRHNWRPPSPGGEDENGDPYPGGWGNCCIEWEDAEGFFSTNQGDTLFFVIFDPLDNEWQYCGTNTLEYAEIDLNLWVEMYMYLEYNFTTYKWHRIGRTRETETICFLIQGLIQSNSEQHVGLVQLDDDNPIGQLTFRGSIFGDPGDYEEDDPNIPITWEARYGEGDAFGGNVIMGWTEIEPGPLGQDGPIGVWIPEYIGKCDHWFQFRGCFNLFYHIDDGYYSLIIGGCPTPIL
jgi:hypothetical protein